MELKDRLKQLYKMTNEDLEITFNYFTPESLPAKYRIKLPL